MLLLLTATLSVVGCGPPRRKTCGLAETQRGLKRWYNELERSPRKLRATVDRQLAVPTHVVAQHMARGGVPMAPSLANSRKALRAARCHLARGAWFSAARYLYLALAVLPKGPRPDPQRLAILLDLARSLDMLQLYRRSAVLLMYLRQNLPAGDPRRGQATERLRKLHSKLLQAQYMRHNAARLTAHPLARYLGLSPARPSARPSTGGDFGAEMKRLERDPERLHRRVAERVQQGIAALRPNRCHAGMTIEQRRHIARQSYEGAALLTRAQKFREAIRGLYQVLACIPPGDAWAKVRLPTLLALSRLHGLLSERRTSLIYHLYVQSARRGATSPAPRARAACPL